MLQPDSMDTVVNLLPVEAFYLENHQRIFRAMLGLYSRGESITIERVCERLQTEGELAMIGGPYYVTKLTNAVVTGARVDYECRIVLQKYLAREMIRVGGEMYNAGYDEREDVFDRLDAAEAAVMGIGGHIQNDAQDMDTALMKTLKQIEVWKAMDTDITGIPSGFSHLDRVTRGWQPGEYTILAARPSVGKTAMALAIARNAAANEIRKTGVAFFSLEMKTVALTLRLMAAESGTLMHALQTGQLDDQAMKTLHTKGVSALSKMKIFIDDTPGLNAFQLRSKVRRMKKKHGIGMVVIDYLQLMSGNGQTREQEISGISRSLKNLGSELEVHIIALSQLSRAVEGRSGARRQPMLSDLRESGAIEQDADNVLLLWGPDEDEVAKDHSLKGRRYLRIAKARNGMLTMIDLDFDSHTQLFREYEKPPEPGKPPAGFVPVKTIPLF